MKAPGLWIRIRINLSCWIRIRMLNADPDPGGQRLSTNIEKSRELSFFEVLRESQFRRLEKKLSTLPTL